MLSPPIGQSSAMVPAATRGGDIAAELAVQAVGSRLGRSAGLYDDAVVIEALALANAAVRARRRTDADLADMAATLSIAACISSCPAPTGG